MDKRFVDKILGKDVIPEEICYAYECNQFRIIHPDDIITMDYDPKRVNIIIDYSDVILRVYVG
jgi:hypothetical protein